jgi:hypothetical protein
MCRLRLCVATPWPVVAAELRSETSFGLERGEAGVGFAQLRSAKLRCKGVATQGQLRSAKPLRPRAGQGKAYAEQGQLRSAKPLRPRAGAATLGKAYAERSYTNACARSRPAFKVFLIALIVLLLHQ